MISLLDWCIITTVAVFILCVGIIGKHYMQSVSDFLAAGRSAGRYMMTVSGSMAALGAISIVNFMQMNYEAGFALAWWDILSSLVLLILAASGWVRYRFRQTRCLTLAEFFERRYSRKFRIFAGIVGFCAGLINFGIFPAVGTMFFIQFLGLPESFCLFSLEISTYTALMIFLVGIALLLVLAGGQVSVLITDFFQGAYANIIFIFISLFLLVTIPWQHVADVLSHPPAGHSKINPFDTGNVRTFNFPFIVIGILGLIYNAMSWQGEQAYNASAESAHETKMAQVLSTWRDLPRMLLVTLMPMLIFVALNHHSPDSQSLNQTVQTQLANLENPSVQSQMRVPLTLAQLLPMGLIGAFASMMLAAFVSTHNTYLHSWASIFVQDVLIPLRGKPLSPKAHLRALRLTIFNVAVFIICFSQWFTQNSEIMLYMALTGSIFAGWSGAVLIGGLYWKRGNSFGAWAAGIIGLIWTVGTFILTQIKHALPGQDHTQPVSAWASYLAEHLPHAEWIGNHLPNGQWIWGISMGICSVSYIIFSLLKPSSFDLTALLKRSELAGDEVKYVHAERSRWSHRFGINNHFSRSDARIYWLTYGWNAFWVLNFLLITGYAIVTYLSTGAWWKNDDFWINYWHFNIWIKFIAAFAITIWFLCGGIRDLKRMLHRLKTQERDATDDGFVEKDSTL